ncbi:MAG: methylthioribulose 1-phosphate dehydratase [Chthoniobacterales bacterium]
MSNPYIEQLIHAATAFYRNGWMVGTSGNLSARQDDDSFWITASGRPKGTLTAGDFVRMSLSGEILEAADGARPSAETSIHQVIYTRFPRARAIYHVHSVEGNLVTSFSDADEIELPPLEMLKGFHIMEDQPKVSIPVFKNHSEVARIAREIHARFQAEQFRLPALLIRRHGVTVWSETQEETMSRVELLEFLFKYMVLARQLKIT